MRKYFLLKNSMLLIILATLSFSCKKDDVPTLTTTDVSAITQFTATSGGNITNDGGAAITESGVCWNTSSTPTIANSKTSDGAVTGIFTSQITGLTADTKYYVRAYATNSEGTAYGDEKTFTTSASLTGSWNKTMTITSQSVTYNGTMNLVHHENNTLTGDFVFDDGSGYAELLSASKITGNSVTIEWMLDIYRWSFTGTVNSSYNSMSGTWTSQNVNIVNMGPWSATKTSKKGAVINDRKSINSEKERLLKLLGN